MSDGNTNTAGIDIGKAYLDVALYPANEEIRVTNSAKGYRELIPWLHERAVTRVGMEASGGYEKGVLAILHAMQMEVALLQPRQVRAFAIYRLRRAKNDRLDAKLIAHCTAELDEIRPAPDPRLAPLAEHLRLIEQIEADLARQKTRMEAYHEKPLLRWLKAEIARLERRQKAELLLLGKKIAEQEDLRHRLTLIESVVGIGRRTALTLVILMPELGTLTRAQIASLAGLAPFDRESGQHRGQRHIAGGRGRVRRALYAAAFPASYRWNASLVAFYKRLRANGKVHKQALVACARKLLTFVNAVMARGSQWQNEAPAR